MHIVKLKPGREKSLRFRHPWIFSGALQKTPAIPPGELVQIVDSTGAPRAIGYYNKSSQIAVRVLSFDPAQMVDESFFHRRVHQAAARRQAWVSRDTTGYRVIMSEADGLPGFVCDRFDDWLVLQCLTAGADRFRAHVIQALSELPFVKGIVDVSTDSVRKKEGLESRQEQVFGSAPIPAQVVVQENGLPIVTSPGQGQKTGFFFDQRDNRSLIRSLAKGHDFLDAFSYTGGFGLSAQAGGARSVVLLDRSEDALSIAKENFTRLPAAASPEIIKANAFDALRSMAAEQRSFSFINLDPPKFATSAGQINKASRGYKDINMAAMRLLRPGGLLATYSCSGHIGPDLFQKIIFGAAVDAGRRFVIRQELRQASCHPIHLDVPESLYLKGLLLQCCDGS